MNLSLNIHSSNLYVQSSGPCVVCDGNSAKQHPQAECATVHPSCLSRVTSTLGTGSTEDPSSSSASVASSTSSCTSSTVTASLPDGLRLWLCSNCQQLQSPLHFPMNNNSDDNSNMYSNQNQSQICYDCSIDMLDYDFGSPMTAGPGDTVTASTCWPTSSDGPDRETIICTCCYQTKDAHEYSSYMTMTMRSGDDSNPVCNDCVIILSGGTRTSSGEGGQYHYPSVPTAAHVDYGNYSYSSSANSIDDNSTSTHHHDLPQLETLSLGLPSTNEYGDSNSNNSTYSDYAHQTQGSLPTSFNNTTTTKNTSPSHPPRTKRKQTRRPKTGTGNNETGDSNSASGNEHQEPVIQWISRRDPLPPNVCSRCRCRYVRPGKKQCQHCAYDYRGTRDHRASMGLCITCAEPLERDNGYPTGQAGGEGGSGSGYGSGTSIGGDNGVMTMTGGASESGGPNLGGPGTAAAGGGGGGGGGGAKPRRSCKACREKNRLKKAADKAARLKMMAAGGGVDGKMGGTNTTGNVGFHAGMVGGGERCVYRTS